jgi:hypothetical protein
MKNLLKIVSIIGLTVITQTAYSAAVTDTFATGDILTAEKINNIKDAVNDNDTRISEIVLTPGSAGADSTVAGPKGDTGADSTVAGPRGPAGLGAVVFFDSAPTAADDMNTYTLGTVWFDTLGTTAYILVDNSPSAAFWTALGGPSTYAIGDAGPARAGLCSMSLTAVYTGQKRRLWTKHQLIGDVMARRSQAQTVLRSARVNRTRLILLLVATKPQPRRSQRPTDQVGTCPLKMS